MKNQWVKLLDAILASTQVSDLGELIQRDALSFLGADYCGLTTIDQTGHSSGVEISQKLASTSRIKEIALRLATEAPAILWDSPTGAEGYYIAMAPCPPNAAAIHILYAEFSTMGTISPEADRTLRIIALARMVGLAIDRIKKKEAAETLMELCRNLTEAQTEDDVYKLASLHILHSINTQNFYIAAYNKSQKAIVLPIIYQKGKAIDSTQAIDPDARFLQGLTLQALADSKAEGTDIVVSPHSSRLLRQASQGVEELHFLVPIIPKNRSPIGALVIQSARSWPLPDSAKQSLRALATLVAPVILRLQEDARKKNGKGEPQQHQTVEAAVAILGMEAAHRRHALVQYISTFSADIDNISIWTKKAIRPKSLLARLLIFLHAIPEPYLGLRKLQSYADRMKQNFHNYEASTSKVSITSRSLIEIGQKILLEAERWSKKHSDIQFRIKIETNPQDQVYANESWLLRGVENLVNNAARAARRNYSAAPEVAIKCYRRHPHILIEVSDSGLGIAPEARPYLFRSLIPGDVVEKTGGGQGTGCLMTSFITRLYDGRAYISPTGKSIVIIELPIVTLSPSADRYE